MSKSSEAFRTISEVADWLETPAHVLRFWESKFTQVKPVKRAGGRRYYRPADMKLLGGIKKLLHDDGLTIKGAQKLLREHGVKHVASLSQPLEEDVIEEAGFIDVPEAPPEPKEPAQVLNFPARDEAEETAEVPSIAPETSQDETPQPVSPHPEPPNPETPETPHVEISSEEAAAPAADEPLPDEIAAPEKNVEPERDAASEARVVDVRKTEPPATGTTATPPADADTVEPVAEEAEPVEEEAEPEPDAAVTDQPAPAGFGSETLPAFLRRGRTAETEGAPPAPSPAPSAPSSPSKVTIDPVVRFVHAAPTAPAPETDTAAPDTPADVADATDTAPRDPVPTTEDRAARQILMADVPPATKIAPEIDSYPAEGGVLSALAGASRLSADLTNELIPHLAELRALRDRMVNSGHK